jgi:nicotinamide-nucleotide adenylyltransferase
MKKEELVGCYWGRFNPIHKGHLNLIKKLLKKVDKLIIAVGSSQEKNTQRNPFSGSERKQMIEAALKSENIPKASYRVITVQDGKTYPISVANLLKKAPKINILFTDKPCLMKAIKKKIAVQRTKRTGTISSTKIREGIAFNKPWKALTTPSVVRLIIKFNGIKRIKKACSS